MPKTKGENADKMCQLILKMYPQQNKNNYAKILSMFTGNVKPYIQLHI